MAESVSRSVVRALATAVLWTACVLLSVSFARESEGLAMVWPAGAVLTAALLTEQPRRRWMPVLAVLIASAIWAYQNSYNTTISGLIALARIAESLLAAWIINRFVGVDDLFNRPSHVFRFTFAAIVACLPSALFTGILLDMLTDRDWMRMTAEWMASHACGLLILTPVLLIIRQAIAQFGMEKLDTGRLVRASIMLGIVALVTGLVFIQTTYTLAFVVVPVLLVATFRLRAPGAAASVVIIAVIGSICLIAGRGPFSLMQVSSVERAFVMEAYIATMFLCALPLAAILNERDRLGHMAARHHANLVSVAERVVEVLFRVDDEGRWAYLSPSYEVITGRPVHEALGQRVLNELPAHDRSRLVDAFQSLKAGAIDDALFSTTMIDAHGQRRFIEATLFRVVVDDEEHVGIGGLFRDVTAQKMLEQQLENRARTAQIAARKSERAALTDELTGLPNRRAFLKRLGERLEEKRSFTLALFDIDHFKKVNDSYGHLAGDEVLRRISTIASDHLEGWSMIARMGGEEFGVLIDGVTPAAALGIARGLLDGIRAQPIAVSGDITDNGEDALIPVTVSMGTVTRRAGQGPGELLAAADRALYAAKNAGRNQLQQAA